MNDQSDTKSQKLAQNDKRLAVISLEKRLQLFDPENTLQASLAEAWEVVKDNVAEHVSAAANALLSHPAFEKAIGNNKLKMMENEGNKRTINKFINTINQAWLDELCELGAMCHKLKAPCYIAVITVHAGAAVFRSVAMRKLQHDTVKMERVVQTISRLEALEMELIVAMMSQLKAQDEQTRLIHHSDVFEHKVIATVTEIAAASAQLRAEAESASGESREMLKRSTEVASATNQSTIAMRETAQLAAKLSTVIDGTYNGIGRAANNAANAADQSETTMNTVITLAQNAKEIESVLSLIKNIAGQTNLLALNATIEAARAGDAGRGFSVVAQEVKSLAGQVAKATDEIARQIAAVQIASEKAVVATRSVGERVAHIHSSASQMQSEIGDQMSSVIAISTAVEETTSSADDIAVNINSVRAASERMANTMAGINSGTVAVDTMLAKLRTDLDLFRQTLKAAA
jgi:methyl-accepting chemotaxis protein